MPLLPARPTWRGEGSVDRAQITLCQLAGGDAHRGPASREAHPLAV